MGYGDPIESYERMAKLTENLRRRWKEDEEEKQRKAKIDKEASKGMWRKGGEFLLNTAGLIGNIISSGGGSVGFPKGADGKRHIELENNRGENLKIPSFGKSEDVDIEHIPHSSMHLGGLHGDLRPGKVSFDRTPPSIGERFKHELSKVGSAAKNELENSSWLDIAKHVAPIAMGIGEGYAEGKASVDSGGDKSNLWKHTLSGALGGASEDIASKNKKDKSLKFQKALMDKDYASIFTGNDPEEMKVAYKQFSKDMDDEKKDIYRKQKEIKEDARFKEKMDILRKKFGLSIEKFDFQKDSKKKGKAKEVLMSTLYPGLTEKEAKERTAEGKMLGLHHDPKKFAQFMTDPKAFKTTHEYVPAPWYSRNKVGKWQKKSIRGGHYEKDENGNVYIVKNDG